MQERQFQASLTARLVVAPATAKRPKPATAPIERTVIPLVDEEDDVLGRAAARRRRGDAMSPAVALVDEDDDVPDATARRCRSAAGSPPEGHLCVPGGAGAPAVRRRVRGEQRRPAAIERWSGTTVRLGVPIGHRARIVKDTRRAWRAGGE